MEAKALVLVREMGEPAEAMAETRLQLREGIVPFTLEATPRLPPAMAMGIPLALRLGRKAAGLVAVKTSSRTQSGGKLFAPPPVRSAAGVGWRRSVRQGNPVWIAPSWATDRIPLVGM